MPGTLSDAACRTHTGQHAGRTRASMQDARGPARRTHGGQHAGRTQGASLLWTALGAWVHFPRKSAHIHLPPRQACSRRIYAKHVQTIPLLVHSRDAACPRPACLSASWAITHHPRRCASCLLVRVLHVCAPNARARFPRELSGDGCLHHPLDAARIAATCNEEQDRRVGPIGNRTYTFTGIDTG